MQVDAGTYCNRPTGEPELFKEWVKTFSMDQVKGDISELLVSKVEVRALYTKLVNMKGGAHNIDVHSNSNMF